MGCLYEDTMTGECQFAHDDDGVFKKELEQSGSENGICVVSEDPDPVRNCEMYESDWQCFDCGADLNIEECKCEDE